MRRAYWSADFAEAHVVEAMLRAHGVQAWVFDALFVRQDWFKTLGLGGYRVMVADADVARAAELIGEYRAGALAITDDASELPACPQCATPGRADAEPRRVVFIAYMGLHVLILAWLMFAEYANSTTAIILGGGLIAAPIAAIVAARCLKGRYVCPQCSTRWRTRPAPFAAMAREVDAATGVDGSARGEPTP